MKLDVYRYSFPKGTDMEQVTETLLLSSLAAEGLYGRSRLKLDTTVRCDAKARRADVSAGDEAGQAVARIFGALLGMVMGERSFTVRHVVEDA